MRLILGLLAASGLLLAALLLIGTLSRYFDLRFLIGTDEISILVAVWFYFLGVAAASWRQSHIEGGLVQGLAGPRLRRGFSILSVSVTLIVLAVFAYGIVAYAVELYQTGRRSSYFHLPSYLWVLAFAVGLLLSVGCYVVHLVRLLRRRASPAAAGQPSGCP